MVSAKTNGVSEEGMIVRNKDGSIKKTLGRKSLRPSHENRARCSVSEGNVSQSSTTNFEVKNAEALSKLVPKNIQEEEVEKEEGNQWVGDQVGKTQVKEIDASVGRQAINDFMNMTTQMFVEMQAQTVELKNQNSEMKTQLDLIKNKFIPSTITSP